MPATPAHGAPGRGPVLGEGGAAPPVDPDDEDQHRDALAGGEAGAEPGRAEPWVPDANLMRALGLELAELRPGGEAGEPEPSDGPPGDEGAAAAEAPPRRTTTSDGRPPWW